MNSRIKKVMLIVFASIIVMLNGCSQADKSTEKPEITDSVLAPVITNAPTSASTMKPTIEPTDAPVTLPTMKPTNAPITVPTMEPTNAPIDESDEPIVELDKNVEEGIMLDASLAYAIRKELGIDENHIITYEELESVTYLAAFDKPVASLKGISLLKNLTEFHVTSGTIDNIEELCQLSNMGFIDISNCYISEIPDLSACTELESLYLIGNKIKDISPVNKIKSLRSLNLDCNFINSIEPIKDLTNLEMLIIEQNCILDYECIKDNASLIEAFNQGAQGSYKQSVKVENKAKEILNAITEGKDSALEKEKAIYKYIIDNMNYDESLRPSGAYAYSGLMENRGVCGDYAEAFCLLANHAGIETYVCSSDTHAWNIVKIDDKYYHCDALWDDNSDEWLYFNKSTDYIMNIEYHEHDLNMYPICEESMKEEEYK